MTSATGKPASRIQGASSAGLLIHATDAATAITVRARRQLPALVAVVTAGISLTDTALALVIAHPENTDSI